MKIHKIIFYEGFRLHLQSQSIIRQIHHRFVKAILVINCFYYQ